MKQSRRTEGEARLQRGEALLEKSLLEVLPAVAESGRPIFFNSRFQSNFALPIDAEAEALLDMALACIELRDHLVLPAQGSVGQLFLSACAENASADPHRRGPRRLAESLLNELRAR